MAVYTKISQNELEQLMANYDIGKLESFIAIEAGIQNTNYFINTPNARYVLTIFEETLNCKYNQDELLFFMKLMGHLASCNVPCPTVILDKQSKALGEIKGKTCAITSFLKGGELTTINSQHVEELGKNIAKMHDAGRKINLQRANEISLSGWIGIFNSIKNRADEFEPGLAAEIKQNLDYLERNWPEHLPLGIIHGDLFPDNVFFAGDRLVGIIDFYFACNDVLMYDLAICLNSWCFEKNGEFNNVKAAALFSSYDLVRKISADELEALPILALGAAMRFLLSRLYDWLNRVEGALVTTKDPMEYLNKMRFHSKIKSYEEYGVMVRAVE